MLKKIIVLMVLALSLMGVSASAESLGETLMSQLGVSEKQANGGAGSLLKYAKGNLGKEDFSKVSSAIPDMSTLLSAAPKSSGGGLGGMASALGGDALGTLASLGSSFGALGLNADMIQQFIPIILEYVKGSGGDDVMKLLEGALK